MQGVAHLQNQNYLVTESLNMWYKNEKDGHENPHDSYNHHDDFMMKYVSIKEIVKEHLMTFNTRTALTQEPVL